MEAKLTVVGGKANKREVVLQVPATIGRSRDADLTVGHRMISRKHCEAYLVDGLVMIRDVGSLNGTYVHGRRIREAPLPPDEKFSIGPVTFQISYEYSGDRSKLPPMVLAESASTDVTPGKPAAAESSGPTAEPAKQPANSRPKKAEATKPQAPPAAATKPEAPPAAAEPAEEPDFEVVGDDDFELVEEQPSPNIANQESPKKQPAAEAPKKKAAAETPKKKAVADEPKQRPAAKTPKAAKDPEDQLLDDFLNDVQ